MGTLFYFGNLIQGIHDEIEFAVCVRATVLVSFVHRIGINSYFQCSHLANTRFLENGLEC